MTANNDLLVRFKDNFRDLKKADWSQLGELYTDENTGWL